ncbi:MAG TPA: FHA domain-containing protein [Blastocatellia bacterium]
MLHQTKEHGQVSQCEVTLVLGRDGREIRRVPVYSSRFSIGRSPDNDLFVDDPALSRNHALVELSDRTIHLSDLGSRNGTSVNGASLGGTVELNDGDLIELGDAISLTVCLRRSSGVSDDPRQGSNKAAGRLSCSVVSGEHPSSTSQADAVRETRSGGPQHRERRERRGPQRRDSLRLSGVWRAVSGGRPGSLRGDTEHETLGVSEQNVNKARQRSRAENPRRRTSSLAAALVGSGGILIVAILLAVLAERGKAPVDPNKQSDPRPSATAALEESAADQTSNPSSDQTSIPEASVTSPISRAQVEKDSVQLLRQISNDTQPYTFPASALNDITAQVNQYRGSEEVARAIREMAPRCAEIARQSRPIIDPGLAIYAGLADTLMRKTSTDSTEAARRSVPVLTGIWKLLGNQTADDALILIAAYRIGPVTALDGSGRRSHPLLAVMRKVIRGEDATRTVWYLNDQKGIDKQTYDYVIGFVALGVLSQHPREFGLAVEPLTF